MKVMFDTNILLDVFQKRSPYYHDSALCIDAVLEGKLEGWLPAHAITTFFYLLARYGNTVLARDAVSWLLNRFMISPCDQNLLKNACDSEMEDFEDAVVAWSSKQNDCKYIVTRNTKDFSRSPIQPITPRELIELINM